MARPKKKTSTATDPSRDIAHENKKGGDLEAGMSNLKIQYVKQVDTWLYLGLFSFVVDGVKNLLLTWKLISLQSTGKCRSRKWVLTASQSHRKLGTEWPMSTVLFKITGSSLLPCVSIPL